MNMSLVGIFRSTGDFLWVSNTVSMLFWVQVVFLDDFGSNLKPARDLGMVTILARDTDAALGELEKVTGVQVTFCVSRGVLPSSACVQQGRRAP